MLPRGTSDWNGYTGGAAHRLRIKPVLAPDIVHVVAELEVIAHNRGREAVVSEIAQAGDAENRESGGQDVSGNITPEKPGYSVVYCP